VLLAASWVVLGVLAPFGPLAVGGLGVAAAQSDPAADPVGALLDDARRERDDLIQERALLQAVLPPPGSILVLDTSRIDRSLAPRDGDALLGTIFLTALRHVPAEDVGAFVSRYALEGQASEDVVVALALLQQHLALESALTARIAALEARIAALDDRVRSLEASLPAAPSTFDWDLTGTWHAVREEDWGAEHLDDERATLEVESLAREELPTLQLEIDNVHFVPGWHATLTLRPRQADVQAMLDGGSLRTIHPVGTFDGPRKPLSPAREHSGPDDHVAHHCVAWDVPGGIGWITVVDPGGPDERLEMQLRFDGASCEEGVPVDVFLTFYR
jgi:hypothetical protein